MTIAEVIELVVVELEVDGLVVGVVDEDYLREVKVVDEDYLMKVQVMEDLMDDPTCFGAYHQLGFDHQT